jgi:hypothetical protein
MIPAVQSGATPPQDTIPTAVTPAMPSRPASPEPQLAAASPKGPKRGLLNLQLNLPKSSVRPSSHRAAPGSPSSDTGAEVQGHATEERGRKRSLGGRDGPGGDVTGAVKRQKELTPPVRLRRSPSSPKYLVKQSRPVSDLKVMAGLSPRRTETGSPPTLTRSATTGMPSTGTPSLAENPQRSSSPGVWAGSLPAIVEEDFGGFTFSGCDFGENGELTVASSDPAGADRLADTGSAAAPDGMAISKSLILVEFSSKAKAQQDAATSYLAALDGLRGASVTPNIGSASEGSARERDVRKACGALQTAVVICELALESGSPDDVLKSLKDAATQIGVLQQAIAALPIGQHASSASSGLAGAERTLSTSLEDLARACKTGIDILTDNESAMPAPASSATTTQQEEAIQMPDDALLTYLDALMDKEI